MIVRFTKIATRQLWQVMLRIMLGIMKQDKKDLEGEESKIYLGEKGKLIKTTSKVGEHKTDFFLI